METKPSIIETVYFPPQYMKKQNGLIKRRAGDQAIWKLYRVSADLQAMAVVAMPDIAEIFSFECSFHPLSP